MNSVCESENEARFACARHSRTNIVFSLALALGRKLRSLDMNTATVSQTGKLPENVCVHIIM